MCTFTGTKIPLQQKGIQIDHKTNLLLLARAFPYIVHSTLKSGNSALYW